MKNKPFMTPGVFIVSAGSVTGEREKKGLLGRKFDLSGDDKFGKETWEKSEAEMQRLAAGIAMQKAALADSDIDVMFAGDLINQCISSSFGLISYRIPFLGLYGACSTCALGMTMAAVYLSGICNRALAVTSSHYCSAERQFRFPLEYGGQRTPTAQWTVTGAGAFVLSSLKRDIVRCDGEFVPMIVDIMPGCIVDRGISDAGNMGAAMAPSAADTVKRYLNSDGCGKSISDFDMIVTGDLGREGSAILIDLLLSWHIDISSIHHDCGNIIFPADDPDTHAGGSGCGCSAVVMAADILERMKCGELSDILFIGTGALMNTLSVNQKLTIPGIAHLVHLKAVKKERLLSEINESETEGIEDGINT